MSDGRSFDLIVFGATGFTGKYVSKHLLTVQKKKEDSFTFAIAGRSDAKLQDLVAELGTNVPIIQADVSQENSLIEMCKKTKVLINCVGPYRYYGESVVKACLAAKCHYVDITGEPEFMESVYLKYHEEAKQKELVIISACGFDSIPSEIGALFTQKSFPPNYVPSSIESFIEIQPGEKGYATHSTTYECVILGISSQEELNEIRNKISYPKLDFAGPKLALKKLPYYEDRIQRYAILFPGSDASLVRRDQIYLKENVPNFQPVQYAVYYTVSSFLQMTGLVTFFGALSLLSKINSVKEWLLNNPETASFGAFTKAGPTEEQVKEAKTKLIFFGHGVHKDDAKKQCRITVEMTGPDPGYTLTSTTVAQAALCLLNMREKRVGVLSAGAAFYGSDYVERLDKHDIHFTVKETREFEA